MKKMLGKIREVERLKLKTDLCRYLLSTKSGDKWRSAGLRRRSGILVPLFSVFSHRSLGIGDLEDLKLVVDWCKKTGNSILQLLPMNECGPTFCPYDSVSAFALEPMYISLEKAPGFCNKHNKVRAEEIRKKFPIGLSRVNYAIKDEKLRLLWDIYNLAGKEGDSSRLCEFQEKNRHWVGDFALFKVLKFHQSGLPWYDWDQKYKDRDAAALGSFKKEHAREIDFQIWLQWLLHEQFKGFKEYAGEKKILVEGDLPLLVSRDSADAWAHPELFKLEFAAGAPPDMYCAKGQRWGMPTYNWDKIAASDYRYLKDKLRYAENFYDILRIDHVVGLFRIWSIPFDEPLENKGLNGFFDSSEEGKWKERGRDILAVMLGNTRMLLCAEDLGMIPEVCPETLKELGIPGNDVQRWVKDWESRHDFLDAGHYRVLSVSMLSTHDTTNCAAWWQYEAGTVDEELFIRKCASRSIDYNRIKDRLFDWGLSSHGRLRWLKNITSADMLASILGKGKREIADFIELYANSYMEKEKLWKRLKIKGQMREYPDREVVSCALSLTLGSSSVFCIETIVDWLYFAGLFPGDPYKYRINTPGEVNPDNWSLVIPIPLEVLLRHKVNKDILTMVLSSGRQ